MKYQKVRDSIVNYSKQMYQDKLVSATSGNISVRVNNTSDIFAITPSSENYMTLTADRIVIMKTSGEIVYCPENGRPSSEWKMHAKIYERRSDVQAIVHTHSPYATSFAVLREYIPVILIEMTPWLGGSIPVAEYAPAGSSELGDKTVEALGKRNGCILANHGVVAVASDINLAYVRASYIEDAGKIYNLSRTVGTPIILN